MFKEIELFAPTKSVYEEFFLRDEALFWWPVDHVDAMEYWLQRKMLAGTGILSWGSFAGVAHPEYPACHNRGTEETAAALRRLRGQPTKQAALLRAAALHPLFKSHKNSSVSLNADFLAALKGIYLQAESEVGELPWLSVHKNVIPILVDAGTKQLTYPTDWAETEPHSVRKLINNFQEHLGRLTQEWQLVAVKWITNGPRFDQLRDKFYTSPRYLAERQAKEQEKARLEAAHKARKEQERLAQLNKPPALKEWPFDPKEQKRLVWSRPMSQLAKEYAMSDVGIRKNCVKNGIALPPRGHWLKGKVKYRPANS